MESLLAIRLSTLVEGHEYTRLCSGTHIGQGLVLTAKHCFAGTSPWQIQILRGAEVELSPDPHCTDTAMRPEALEVEVHPTLDVARIRWPRLVGTPATRVMTQRPSAGTAALLAGYGLNETGTPGLRTFGETRIVESSNDRLVVDSGDAGACVGDSGGPLFIRDENGLALAGVLARGSAHCIGPDELTPTSAFIEWLEGAR